MKAVSVFGMWGGKGYKQSYGTRQHPLAESWKIRQVSWNKQNHQQ